MAKSEAALQMWNCELKRHGLPAQDGTVSKPVNNLADARLASEEWYDDMQRNHWVVTPSFPKAVETNQNSKIEAIDIKLQYQRRRMDDHPRVGVDIEQLRDEYDELLRERRKLVSKNRERVNKIISGTVADPVHNLDDAIKVKTSYSADEINAIADKQRIKALKSIALMTAYDAEGIYKPYNINAVNNCANMALGIPITPTEQWSHNKPAKVTNFGKMWFPTADGPGVAQLVQQALSKLSGDLSHDNVAAAKKLLKKITGD